MDTQALEAMALGDIDTKIAALQATILAAQNEAKELLKISASRKAAEDLAVFTAHKQYVVDTLTSAVNANRDTLILSMQKARASLATIRLVVTQVDGVDTTSLVVDVAARATAKAVTTKPAGEGTPATISAKGPGMDWAKVKEEAAAKGLLTPEAMADYVLADASGDKKNSNVWKAHHKYLQPLVNEGKVTSYRHGE